MKSPSSREDYRKIKRAIRLREERRERWETEGERSLWKNLSMIGALGWLIVTPTLLGILVGSWLDRMLGSGIFFTGSFIFLGVSLGCFLAWRKVNEP
ncbi:MAG: AtpZ/AtpI family protein [Limibacillus sp.]|jgi:ATP synthase protein I